MNVINLNGWWCVQSWVPEVRHLHVSAAVKLMSARHLMNGAAVFGIARALRNSRWEAVQQKGGANPPHPTLSIQVSVRLSN